MSRVGLIGGLSWESTASYYRYLHQFYAAGRSEWSQPEVLIDSLDFGEVVALQRRGDWAATGELLAESARRLEGAGATVLAIGANTMHVNYDVVCAAVGVPVIDVRDAVAVETVELGHGAIALLGTKYLIEMDFYSDRLAELGVTSVRPDHEEVELLQRIIFDELVHGVVTEASALALRDVALSCLDRGAGVVGLCCTEFGLLMNEDQAFPVIDSTKAHVRALLRA